uniref:NADH-ubiquinone oxidoreductase chain 1 n=1 Tax=Arctica islandica TaxID=59239 RepID=T1QR53_ARCIS|nr:NADH dehydrogenase subunit 1 [Arctica islandica]AGC84105.1 NADH dehydrogenase subunit 1 [Arctica islandica]AGW53604.1 NADH dehydrogenase subunit 1 [Arctica islandica]AGW53616.1 NADH dehydrogenase subunit 1 [Arctica islandica]
MMSCFLVMVLMLVSVAFFIVTERKGLGMLQLRQGPNKASFKGALQAIADGVKLFKKEFSFPFSVSKNMYLLGPFLCFFCAYSLWLLFPSYWHSLSFEGGLLFFLCVSCFSVYGVFLVGWVCDSRYAFLGAMRAVAQSVSYEVFLSTSLFCPLLLVGSFDLVSIREFSFSNMLVGLEVLLLWLIAVLAETNRAPFDFVEGESELVAGYNVEYGGVGFALIALAEYSNIMFMSLLVGLLFFSEGMQLKIFGDIIIMFWMVFFSYFMVWVRGVVPRFRYDLLMNLCWVVLLPFSLCIFSFMMGFSL